MTLTYIDSNAWIYYFDPDTPEHRRAARRLRPILQSDEIAVNTVTVMEVAHYLHRKLPSEEADTIIRGMLSVTGLRLLDFNDAALMGALTILREFSSAGIGGRDATILEAVVKNEIQVLVTQDKALKGAAEKIGVEVIDPAES